MLYLEAQTLSQIRIEETKEDPLEREDSFFVHTEELEDASCTSAWAVMDRTDWHTSSFSTSTNEAQNHSKARLETMETLLPDTGAVDNLIGLNTARRFAETARCMGTAVKWSKLQRPRVISGVGGRPAVAQYQVSIQGKLPSGRSLIYTAPVIGDASADVPALLGLREMSAAGIVNLPSASQLGFVKNLKDVHWPSDTTFVDLVTSPSGHQLLPFLASASTSTSRRPTTASSFPTTSRDLGQR
eukprot:6456226-Amphidinium_carterae.1